MLVAGGDSNVVAFVTHLDVSKALFLASPVNVNLLGPRVGQHLDARFRVLFGQVESQTSPSAAKIEDAEALSLSRTLLSQSGLFAVALEHDLFGLRERLFCVLDVLGSAWPIRILEGWIVARGVLHSRSETQLQERSGDFVMLLVRLCLVFGKRSVGFAQFGDKVHLGRMVGGSGT